LCQALEADLAGRPEARALRLISGRFGNMLSSPVSGGPKFKAQIDAGGPVTVTHPDMVRYFMTIREACDLVVTAASHALGPDRSDVSVYVLNMGQPVKIVDLAERMIRLSGLTPGHDIDIVFTGIRPGEKLFEEMLTARERENPTVNERLFMAQQERIEYDRLSDTIARLDLAHGPVEGVFQVDALCVGDADDRIDDVGELQAEVLLGLAGLLGLVALHVVEQARQLACLFDQAG